MEDEVTGREDEKEERREERRVKANRRQQTRFAACFIKPSKFDRQLSRGRG